MATRSISRRRVAGTVLALLVLAGAGCTRQYQAEQDGKDAGEALCEVRDADDAEAAEAAAADLQARLDDLAADYATFTAEDRDDITENLSDLSEHLANDSEVLIQQDLAVIRRNLETIRDDVSDTSRAAIDGFLQGLDDC